MILQKVLLKKKEGDENSVLRFEVLGADTKVMDSDGVTACNEDTGMVVL